MKGEGQVAKSVVCSLPDIVLAGHQMICTVALLLATTIMPLDSGLDVRLYVSRKVMHMANNLASPHGCRVKVSRVASPRLLPTGGKILDLRD